MSKKYKVIQSKPAKGAIVRDWTGMDFTVIMQRYDVTTQIHEVLGMFEIHDVDKDVPVKGRKGKVGRNGYIALQLPIS